MGSYAVRVGIGRPSVARFVEPRPRPRPRSRYGDERLLAFVLGRPDYPRDVDATGRRVASSTDDGGEEGS